jgi:hypothetical protein
LNPSVVFHFAISENLSITQAISPQQTALERPFGEMTEAILKKKSCVDGEAGEALRTLSTLPRNGWGVRREGRGLPSIALAADTPGHETERE